MTDDQIYNLAQQSRLSAFDAITVHAVNGAQRQADGAAHYAENLRYAYLIGKDRVSFAESTGVRHVEESGSGQARRISRDLPGDRAAPAGA
jgi:hypothetical protein